MSFFKFLPYPIQWYEGMLLMPQHFQQSDVLHRRTLAYHLSTLNPYHWGVLKLEIDTALLVNGLFRVLTLEAILPDGTIVFFPQEEDQQLEIDLTEIKELQAAPLKVYLALPEARLHETPGELSEVRYESVESSPVLDRNTGENGIPITRLRPKLKLIVSSSPPARFVCVPLAEINVQGNSFTQTAFLPPQIQISLSSGIGKLCLELSQRIREKLAYLQGKIQNTQANPSASSGVVSEIEQMRSRLIIGLLPFESVLQTGSAHPYTLFMALTTLAAQGVALRVGLNPPVFLPYRHDDPGTSFQQLITFLDDVLAHIEEAYLTVPFIQKERVFSLTLLKEWDFNVFILGARAQPGMREDDLVKWVQECVIATDSFVHLARDNRVLGAAREIVYEIPALNLTPSRGTVLFLVKKDPRFMLPAEALRVFNISDNPTHRPQSLFLYLPNRKKA